MNNNTWFTVENNLIDRNDLNIYEKMCSVVLARYAGRAEFSNMLNIQVIAIRMGCAPELAEKALNSLISKRLVTLEDAERIEPEMLAVESIKVNSKVIRSDETGESKPQPSSAFEHLESFDEEEPKPVQKPKKSAAKAKKPAEEPVEVTAPELEKEPKRKPGKRKAAEPEMAAPQTMAAQSEPETKSAPRPIVPKQVREGLQTLIDQVFEIVDENINDREARIILSFANNDIELIREKYKAAKRSQVSDKIEMLINELQRKDEPQSKREVSQATANSQIDLENINRMVAFKQSSYAKQGNKPR